MRGRCRNTLESRVIDACVDVPRSGTWIEDDFCGIVIAVQHREEERMEHKHIIVEDLSDISSRLHALAKHLEGEHEKQHWDKACIEIDTLLRLVESRIAARGGF